MIKVLLIENNKVKTVAVIDYVNTWYSHCDELVEAIAKTIYADYVTVERIVDDKYPIAYRLENSDKYKVVATNIN